MKELKGKTDSGAQFLSWISVADEIPDVRCIAYTESDDIGMEYRIIPKGFFRQVATDATHWMPMPEPPKGAEL